MNTRIAFDIDGTLFDELDNPRHEVIDLLRWFLARPSVAVYVLSGSGVDYAERKVEKLGLKNRVSVVAKGSVAVDIAVDDQPECKLGTVNVIV